MITIEIKHLDELLNSLDKDKFKDALNIAMKKSMFTLERTAKINTPVDTGLLRNSYETNFGDLEATLRNFRNYAPYVEARVGFIEKTYQEEEPPIQSIFGDEIQTLIDNL